MTVEQEKTDSTDYKNSLTPVVGAKPQNVTLQNIEQTVAGIAQSVEEGWASPLEVLATFKVIEAMSARVKERIEPNAIREWEKEREGNKREIRKGIFGISTMTTSGTWDCSEDVVYANLVAERERLYALHIQSIDNAIEARKSFLISLAKNSIYGMEEIDKDTGEVTKPVPAKLKGGKTVLRFCTYKE